MNPSKGATRTLEPARPHAALNAVVKCGNSP